MGTDAGPRRMLASALDGVTTLRLRSRRGGAAVAAPFAYELAGEDARLYALVSDGAELRAALKRDPRVIVEAGGGGVPAVSGAARAVPVRDARAAADWRAAIAGRAAVATPDGAATVLRIVPEGLAVGPGEAGATTFFLRGPAGLAPLYGGRRRRARGLLARFVYYTRADVVPVMAMPVAIGTALAWREGARGRPGRLAVALAGAVAAHLAANVTNDYFDYRSGADERAAAEIGSLETGSGMLTGGVLAERQVVALAGGLWAVALGCGLVLAALAGPAIPALAGLGFLLAYGYVAPPLAFGYRGRGLGEAAILLAFGVLPALGGYYAQTGRMSSR
ncbi:MAG TPA: prenyltransferase, partial [Thermomicrobiales bacterium]|nr:prenyltransferase [Thermomicrobiales bacterium]